MSEAYSETVLDHFRNPRNVGCLEIADAFGQAENPASGASLELWLRVAGREIVRATFQAQGCTATIAAGSMLTELLPGKTLEQAGRLSRADIETALDGLPATRKHAAFLAEDVTRAAVADCQARMTDGSHRHPV